MAFGVLMCSSNCCFSLFQVYSFFHLYFSSLSLRILSDCHTFPSLCHNSLQLFSLHSSYFICFIFMCCPSCQAFSNTFFVSLYFSRFFNLICSHCQHGRSWSGCLGVGVGGWFMLPHARKNSWETWDICNNHTVPNHLALLCTKQKNRG